MAGNTRRRAVRGDHLRNHEALLDAALAVFDEQGLTAPLHQIAKRASVSEASLYRHFAGRDELVLELYSRHAGRLEQMVLEALRASEGASFESRIWAFFEALIPQMVAHESYGAIAARAALIAPPRTGNEEFLAAVTALVTQGQDSGALAREVTGVDLVILALSIATPARMDRSPAGTVWRRHLTFNLRGFTPEAATSRAFAVDPPPN